MNTVKVKKDKLLEKLLENREGHRAIFLEAQEGYRAEAVKLLDDQLERARNGQKFTLIFDLPVPEDHTADYDNVIGMMQMSVDDEIELTASEYRCYVMDDWVWRRAWLNSNAGYSITAASYMSES